MIDHDALDHALLVERFRRAVDWFSYDARAEHLRKYIERLHIVEQDYLDRDATEIELPSWV